MDRRNFLKRYSLLPFIGSLATGAKAGEPETAKTYHFVHNEDSKVKEPKDVKPLRDLKPETRLDLLLYAVKYAKSSGCKIERIEARLGFIRGLHFELEASTSYSVECSYPDGVQPILIDGHIIHSLSYPFPQLFLVQGVEYDLVLICDRKILYFLWDEPEAFIKKTPADRALEMHRKKLDKEIKKYTLTATQKLQRKYERERVERLYS